jgi:Zn-dependent protease with chaperone function
LTCIAGVTFLAIPGHGGLGALLGELNSCWAALSRGAVPSWEESFALTGVLLLAGIAARLGVVAARQSRFRRRRRDRYRFLVALVAPEMPDGRTVIWLEHPQPVAFSLAGNPGLVIVSQGLRRRLAPLPLAATLEHEHAHLRGHHQLLVDVVDAAAAALPMAPLFRAAPAACRELVELAADAAAVRRYGNAAVGEALRSLITAPRVTDGLAMATTAADRRLSRLESGRKCWPVPFRAIGCVAAGVISTVLPAALGLSLLLGVACSVG